MTDYFKYLLRSYGLLYITLTTLEGDRPGNPHESLEKYYESLGPLEDGEPIFVVRISGDGEHRIVSGESARQLAPADQAYDRADLTVMELPEDEFYFFQAFRPALFDLEKELPPFLYQMALVHAYTVFENYLSEVIRLRLRKHPALAGLGKQVVLSEIIESSSREELINDVVDREVKRLMYEPLIAILEALRSRLGFRTLTTVFDQQLQLLSLTRNCIIHNAARVDPRLAAVMPSASVDQRIEINLASVSIAIRACRKFGAAIDSAFEALDREM
jgi:hypothetical protein